MEGELRREKLMEVLRSSAHPVSGSEIAKQFQVSRQVIVQDIALLRAVNKNILSTNKGYLLYDPFAHPTTKKRIFYVSHSDEQIEEELNTIIDHGGRVLDVIIEHEVYGSITVDLVLKSRKDVVEFQEKMKNSKDLPLKSLTKGWHYHTIEADSTDVLDRIENQLREKGFV